MILRKRIKANITSANTSARITHPKDVSLYKIRMLRGYALCLSAIDYAMYLTDFTHRTCI